MSSRKKNKKIQVSVAPRGRTEVRALHARLATNSNIRFSFQFFNAQSIRIDDFNNFYANHDAATKSTAEFISALSNLSRMSRSEVFSPSNRKSIRAKEIQNDDAAVERIEKVLLDGYKMPAKLVTQFERSYIEFGFGDGCRVMSIPVGEVLYPLFIDCNHLICRESSRLVTRKMQFSYPSLLGIQHGAIAPTEINIAEMIMESAVNGEYRNINEAVKDYLSLKNI